MSEATQELTVVAEIEPDPDRRAALIERLEALQRKIKDDPSFLPGQLPDTHFMRFALVEDEQQELPALLVWETNHDGDADAYLEKVAKLAPAITCVFEACRAYPAQGTKDVAAWVRWIRDHAVGAGAFYAAYPGVSRAQVIRAHAIHAALRAALDDKARRAELAGRSPSQVHRLLRERVRATLPPSDAPVPDSGTWRRVGATLVRLPIIALTAVGLVLGLPWLLYLRLKREPGDPRDPTEQPVHDVHRLAVHEDNVRQNQLTHLVDLRPGRLRLATLRFVLHVIDLLARVHFVRGSLGGITSIHFARWVILRDPRPGKARHRLLFFSNYDGSWESYLGEFVDRASSGLTGVWSNTEGFPATRWLIRDGARDEEAFKQWARRRQIRTHLWWSGVPRSTVRNVLDDLWIWRNLERDLDDEEARAWLRKV